MIVRQSFIAYHQGMNQNRLLDSLTQPEEALLTARQVSELLQVHITTVRRWSKNRQLKSYRLGGAGHHRYMLQDVKEFLSAQDIDDIPTQAE